MTFAEPFAPPPAAAPAALSWQPSDNNLLAASDPLPTATGNNNLMTAGTLNLSKIPIRQAMTLSNLWFMMQTAGVGASSGSFVGLYSSAGALLTGSADIGAAFTAAGPVVVGPLALTTPQALAAGSFVWAAILMNLATTQPTLQRVGAAGSILFANLGLTAAQFRYAANGTLLSALPANIGPGSNTTGGGFTFWAGAS